MLDTVAVPRPRQALQSQAAEVSATWRGALNVLAIIARPGQESADLGTLLYAFSHAGAGVALLSLSRGEASPVNSSCERLETIRPRELRLAAWVLGVDAVAVADYPDRRLARIPPRRLTERVMRAIRTYEADLLLVIDPAGSDDEDAAVAAAAVLAARQAGVPVMARGAHCRAESWPLDLGVDAEEARAARRAATAAHVSQSRGVSAPALDGSEYLCWLSRADESDLRLLSAADAAGY